MMEFTLTAYETLLQAINKSNYKVYGVNKWITQQPKLGILLRHDIDRKALNALKVAELEKKYNILSTYYFRITANSFKPHIIEEIANLGHEIGYHYEDLSLTSGDYKKAYELFSSHLQQLQKLADIKTIAMHGRPLSKFDNRDLWKKKSVREFGLIGEAFLDIDYSDTFYFTDTGRSWSNGSVNLRDVVSSNKKIDVNATKELIEFITKNPNQKIALVTHPERWNDRVSDYVFSWTSDMTVNAIKRVIKAVRM